MSYLNLNQWRTQGSGLRGPLQPADLNKGAKSHWTKGGLLRTRAGTAPRPLAHLAHRPNQRGQDPRGTGTPALPEEDGTPGVAHTVTPGWGSKSKDGQTGSQPTAGPRGRGSHLQSEERRMGEKRATPPPAEDSYPDIERTQKAKRERAVPSDPSKLSAWTHLKRSVNGQ